MIVIEGGKGNITEWIHIRDILEKNFKVIGYFGIYSRRSKRKVTFIKMIGERILSIKKSIAN